MAISKQELEIILKTNFPNAQIELIDTAGDEDHYSLVIKDSSFAGVSTVSQHKMVKEALKDVLLSNRLHAISIKTLA